MNILIGCASRDTKEEIYNQTAKAIGEFIVKNGHNLLFGGCDNGLMGKVYSIVSKSDTSKIIIASVKAYEDDMKNLSYHKASVHDTVNERKNDFIKLADIMVFIPGGIGTLDEILTAIETKRAHEHDKPIIIVNVNNFFGPLLDMLDKFYNEGFADPKNREVYFVANTLEDAIMYLSNLSSLSNS